MCHSPKVAGLRLVTSDVCRACPFADHHRPGDGSGPDPDVRPDMPVERLIELIDGPARPWPPGWEDWDVTRRAHRIAADRFLAGLEDYPSGQHRGRGIVIAGGAAYFPSVYVTVRAIRHVGCVLPIQVWYLGRNDELPSDRRALLARYGVECIDADVIRTHRPCRILNGWELKVYAVLHSRFEEVLWLDADCYPASDPTVLFDEPRYRAAGAVFWPDIPNAPGPNWPAFGVTAPRRAQIETGQFLVNKRACWRPLRLAWWYCDHSDWSFMHGYGDKGALEVAWPACGYGHARYSDHVRWFNHSYLHFGPDGAVLLVHRCRDKFRFADVGYMTPQSFATNRFEPSLPLEAECFSWLGELGRLLADGRPRPAPEIRAVISTRLGHRDKLEATLARWRATDWECDPLVVTDAPAERVLRAACDNPADYYLFLEDDLIFNLHLRDNLTTWRPLQERTLWIGALLNPGVGLTAPIGEAPDARSAWVDRASNGPAARAVVLSRPALEATVREWGSVPGDFHQRLTAIALRYSPAVVVHTPSLAQHLPAEGSPARAVDFDPFFCAGAPDPGGSTVSPVPLPATVARPGDPAVGVVIGSYQWPELVDLQCRVIRATCGPVPILVSSDHPASNAALEAICAAYPDVTFSPNPQRIGHTGGDMAVFHKGVVWGQERGLAVVAKLSQRFIVTRERWLQDGAADLLASGLPLASRRCRGFHTFDLRTEAVLLDVARWHVPAVLERFRPQRYWGSAKGLYTEDLISHALHLLGGVYWPWGLFGEDRSRRDADVLWHYSNPTAEYRALAERHGVTLPANFHCDGWGAEMRSGEYIV